MLYLKKNQVRLAKFLTVTFLFGIFGSCSKNVETSETINELETLNGEDIFRGVFFLQGEISNKLPSLRDAKVSREAILDNPQFAHIINGIEEREGITIEEKMQRFSDELIEAVNEISPDTFDDLEKALQSGDIDHFNQVVRESGKLLNTAILQNEEVADKVKLADYAYEKGNINPQDYDFSTADGIDKYNKALIEFAVDQGLEKEVGGDEAAGFSVVFVFLVVAVVLVAVGAYLVAAIGGGALLVIAGAIYIELEYDWGQKGRETNTSGDDSDNIEFNMMLAEIMSFYNA